MTKEDTVALAASILEAGDAHVGAGMIQAAIEITGPSRLALTRGEILDVLRNHAQQLDREIDGTSTWSVNAKDIALIRERLTRIEYLLRGLEATLK